MKPVSRRRLLGAGVIAAAALAGAGLSTTVPPPKETGLTFEGLLKNQPGFQPRRPAPLAPSELLGFLSHRQLARTYAVYRETFAKLLATEAALAAASGASSDSAAYARLRHTQVEAANSVLLHELYFGNLATAPVAPSRYVIANINEHMGSLERWRADFAACARVAANWAVLIYDPYDDRWHNAVLGGADAGGWIGGNPLVVCAVADYAWSTDYHGRAAYVDAFLDRIDWKQIAARYRAVDRQ
jgi:superoxide dismutase, Fe-Mn family